METILDLEGTAILSTACTFSLTSINVRNDFFPSGRNTHTTHCENFDTLLGPEPDIPGPLSTGEINTTLPEIGRWITEGNSPTTPELGTWTTIEANSTAKADNWSPSFTEIDLYQGNISPTETADTEDGYQEMCLASLQQETSYSKSHNVRVIKHKPSAITFTDLPLDIICDSAGYDNDTQEDKESDDDTEEEDENDDVFTDLPRYKYAFTGIKRRSSHPRSPQKTFTDSKDIFQMLNKKYRNSGIDLGEEERKTSTDTGSPWSQSMTCLMMKLDQLNVDIEGAINASSFPPCFSHEESEEQVPPETLNYTVAGFPIYCGPKFFTVLHDGTAETTSVSTFVGSNLREPVGLTCFLGRKQTGRNSRCDCCCTPGNTSKPMFKDI